MASAVSEDQSSEAPASTGILRSRQNRAAIRDARSMRRFIIKQGYLRKMPNSAKLGSSFRQPERRWFIFGVINGRYPYLEYYENEACIFNSRPLKTMFLDSCLYVTRNQRTNRHNNVFTLVLRERSLSLVADSRDIMSEWCRAIEDKLHNLHIIDTVGGDNDYVKVPTPRRRRPATMVLPASEPLVPVDPTPPAPTPDVTPPPQSPAAEAAESSPAVPVVYETLRQDATGGVIQPEYLLPAVAQELAAEPVDLTELLVNQQMNAAAVSGSSASSASSQQPSAVKKPCQQPSDVYYLDARLPISAQQSPLYTNMAGLNRVESLPTSEPSEQLGSVTVTSVFTSTSSESHSSALSTAVISTAATTSDVLRRPSASAASSTNPAGPSPCGSAVAKPLTFRLPSYEESMSSDAAILNLSPIASPTDEANTEMSMATSPLPGYESPPSYVSNQLLELNANTPLKSRQVQQLQDEMSNDAGVRIQLDKTQCAQALALIDCFDRVWIAGWNRRAYPMLQASFHIGDQLISINDQPVTTAKVAVKMLKSCADKVAAQLVLKRLPAGYVCLLRRDNSQFESLGLQTVAGTAEISRVDSEGIAAEHGFPQYAANVDGSGPCNWWITEVNHRSLNLFYRDGEVVRRLSAAGSHLSFVAQPTPLIMEMKRRLRTMKYFKDYLIE